jgi:putative ABC transport system permease protein
MLKNYFLTAVRNLRRNRTFALINILGLVLGISGAVVIYRIIIFEKSFDSYHSNIDNVYRVAIHQETEGETQKGISVQHPLGEALRNDMPDATISRIHWYSPGVFQVDNNQGVTKKFRVTDKMAFVEQDFFSIFDFNWLAGNPDHLLDEPNSMVLSASAADKLFELDGTGYQSVLGKTVTFENKLNLKINGVYQDPPKNTDFDIHYLMEYQGAKIYPYASGLTSWQTRNGSARCFVKLPSNQTEIAAEAQLKDLSAKYLAPLGIDANVYYSLQPLADIHMSEEYGGNSAIDNAALTSLRVIALILLITASINFINLATAQSVKRAKEIGIRKVLGSSKRHLVFQFLGEVFLITLVSVVISLGLSEAALMKLEPFLGYSLGLNIISEPQTLLFLLGITIAVTLLSGFYPAVVLSRYNPVDAIKNSKLTSKKGNSMSIRRSLVVLQFLISQTLIIGTLVVVFQMDFMKSKPLGFDKENLLTFTIPDNKQENLDLLSSQIEAISAVEGISFYIASPGGASTNNIDEIKGPSGGEDDYFRANRKNVDFNYGSVFKMELLAGEFYRSGAPSNHAVINRKFMNQIGITNAEEAIGSTAETTYGRSMFIVGVVEDFHNNSMKSEMDAVFMMDGRNQFFEAGLRLNANADTRLVIDQVESIWNEIFVGDVFVHQFLDDTIAAQYETEARISELFQVFAGMAIFICCLGLYGLVSFMANQKTKEIGVRKVLGASVRSIVMIFSKEVIMLVAAAFIIAAPLTYYIMSGWLNGYAYKIDMGVSIFIIGILATAIIAMITVGSRAMNAATANPVKSLRDE